MAQPITRRLQRFEHDGETQEAGHVGT